MPSRKTTRVRAPKPGRGQRKIGLTSALGPKMTVSIVIVVLAGGLMLGAHVSAGAKTTPADAPSTTAAADTATPPSTSAPAKTHAKAASAETPDVVAENSPASKTPVTTIAGCLERDGATFRLKDTSGADAPKARSWKSGFIKKNTASVDVLDRGHEFGLASRVGERLSVTGTLVDRTLQARSVRRISSSCSN